MVEPASDGRRREAVRRIAVGFTLLVAVSAAGSASYGGATGIEAAVAGAAGLLTGIGLLVALGVRP